MYEDIIRKLAKDIHNKENGIVVSDMVRNGVKYTRNFGVSIMHLRQLASRLDGTEELADILWAKDWRETKIIATLLIPSTSSTVLLHKWATESVTSELVEQMALNTCVRHEQAADLVSAWSTDVSESVLAVAYTTLAHLSLRNATLDNAYFEGFLGRIEELAMECSSVNKRALALALRRIGRRSISLNKQSVKIAQRLSENNNINCKWVAEDTITELTDEYIIGLLK